MKQFGESLLNAGRMREKGSAIDVASLIFLLSSSHFPICYAKEDDAELIGSTKFPSIGMIFPLVNMNIMAPKCIPQIVMNSELQIWSEMMFHETSHFGDA